MLALLEDYFERLDALHAEIERVIAGLSQEALDWVPGEEMNSLGVLIVHTTGSERYWIGEVIGRDPAGRDRPAEFRTSGLDGATLRQRLVESLDHARRVLESLTLQDLESTRDLEAQYAGPQGARTVRVAWVLAHALQHTATHTGHAQIVRQMWDQRARG